MPAFLLFLLLAWGASAPAFAVGATGVSFCGGTVTESDPTDMSNQVGDMSLQAAVDQPASLMTCGKGYLLAKCGDHDNANRIFDKCIAAGYVGAMIWKALQTENGNGTPRDLAAAAELLRRAAESDDPGYGPIARLHYATVLHEGRGVARDREAALILFRRAAEEGNEEAAEFLRTGYHTGARDERGLGAGIPTRAAMAPLGAVTVSGVRLIPSDDSSLGHVNSGWRPMALGLALLAAFLFGFSRSREKHSLHVRLSLETA